MRKGIIVNLKKFKVFDYVNINRIFLLLSVLFIAGIAVGAGILSKNGSFLNFINNYFKNTLSLHNSDRFFTKLISCFLRYFLIILLYFLTGSSMLGVAVTPFITAWQGIFYGNLISYFYKMYGINGVAFNAIIFIPPTIVFVIVCFFAARYAINFSLLIARLTLPRSRPTNLFNDFKNYCSKFLVLSGVALFCAVFEIVLNLLFLKFFVF